MTYHNVRSVALDLLMRIEKEGSFSHLLISQAIKQGKVSPQDENLLTEIVYGTLEHQLTLDYYLEPFIRSQKKLPDWVRMLLRMSLFQMHYLDHVPAYAVINEAVDIAKERGHRGISGVVNGVLRNIQRKGVPSTDTITDPLKKIAIETSTPEWLVKRWATNYGIDTTRKMCEINVTKKPIAVRVNRLRSTREEVLTMLKEQHIEASASPLVSDGIIIEKGNIFKTDLLQRGFITVQDESSMLATVMLDVAPGMRVLDTCSAPGGKVTHIGEYMENEGDVFAHDLHQNKLKLISDHAKRLGISNIAVTQSDARNLQNVYEKMSFDRILIDAPCSGLGVIRAKPDIKYSKQPSDMEKLHDIQLKILHHVAPLLKKGGKLIYSTCTVDTMENEEVVKRFIQNEPEFEVDDSFLEEVETLFAQKEANITPYGLQLFPQTIGSDGFFMTRIKRK